MAELYLTEGLCPSNKSLWHWNSIAEPATADKWRRLEALEALRSPGGMISTQQQSD